MSDVAGPRAHLTPALRAPLPVLFGLVALMPDGSLKTQLMAERTETKRDATSLELEIGLKSILGELPPSGWAVQVYFVTDSKAAGRVGAMLDRTGLNGSTWPVYVPWGWALALA